MSTQKPVPNVYLLRIDVYGAREYYLDDEDIDHDGYYETYFSGQPLPKQWTFPKHHLGDRRKALKDFVAGDDRAPFVFERVVRTLKPAVAEDVEFVSIGTLCGRDYYVMNVVRVIDCLDRAKSEIQYSSEDGSRITNIWRYAFCEARIPSDVMVFKIPEDFGRIFVRRGFTDCIRKGRFSGVTFERTDALGMARVNHAVPGLPVR